MAAVVAVKRTQAVVLVLAQVRYMVVVVVLPVLTMAELAHKAQSSSLIRLYQTPIF